MSKYKPLQDYLKTLSSRAWTASFSDVEKLIDGKLPKSAYEYPAWWSNNPTGHTYSRAWVDAGWMTENVNLAGQTLTFRRVNSTGRKVLKKPANVIGFMKGSVTVLGDHDLTSPFGGDWGVGADCD